MCVQINMCAWKEERGKMKWQERQQNGDSTGRTTRNEAYRHRRMVAQTTRTRPCLPNQERIYRQETRRTRQAEGEESR